MPQFGIIALAAERLAFARRNRVSAGIQKPGIGREPVAEIALRRGRVVIRQGLPTFLGTGFSVQLIWEEDDAMPQMPYWKKVLKKMEMKTPSLGAFRQEANAEKIAEAVAEFAGFRYSIRHCRK